MSSNLPGFDKPTLENIAKMTADERLALIRKALYSDEHLLKVVVRIMIVADPESFDDIMLWFKKQNS